MKFFLPSAAIVLALALCAQSVPTQENGQGADVAKQQTQQDSRLWSDDKDDSYHHECPKIEFPKDMICKNIPEFPKDMICKNIPEFPKEVTCKHIPNVCPDLEYLVCVEKAEAAAFTPITAPATGCSAGGITIAGGAITSTIPATVTVSQLLCALSGLSAGGTVTDIASVAALLSFLLGDLFTGLAAPGVACGAGPAAGSCSTSVTSH
ncbi:unnamed protein product [Umbelopsis vinacea]